MAEDQTLADEQRRYHSNVIDNAAEDDKAAAKQAKDTKTTTSKTEDTVETTKEK